MYNFMELEILCSENILILSLSLNLHLTHDTALNVSALLILIIGWTDVPVVLCRFKTLPLSL